jgi:hypothetical protein
MKLFKSIDVGGCDVDCIPQGMGQLEILSHLDLKNNKRLMKLPKCIEEMKLPKCIEEMKLPKCIEEMKLPKCIEEMKSLTCLM